MIVRSALRIQFWLEHWHIERERVKLIKTLPSSLTEIGRPVPYMAQLIPALTEDINLLNNNSNNHNVISESISLRSLIKQGRYLVVNFGSCT